MNHHLARLRNFLNPVILEKLVDRFGIDEIGTNYPKTLYNPHDFSPEEYYDRLATAPLGRPVVTTIVSAPKRSRWDQSVAE